MKRGERLKKTKRLLRVLGAFYIIFLAGEIVVCIYQASHAYSFYVSLEQRFFDYYMGH